MVVMYLRSALRKAGIETCTVKYMGIAKAPPIIPIGAKTTAKQHKYENVAPTIANIPINTPAPIITTNKIITIIIPKMKKIGSKIMRIIRRSFGFSVY